MRVALAVLCAAALTIPGAAQAQSCPQLKAQLQDTNGELGQIALNYPKTHLAIVACIYGNDLRTDQQSCVATVIFGACLGLGPDGCSDLTSRWAGVGVRYYTIISQLEALGCRP